MAPTTSIMVRRFESPGQVSHCAAMHQQMAPRPASSFIRSFGPMPSASAASVRRSHSPQLPIRSGEPPLDYLLPSGHPSAATLRRPIARATAVEPAMAASARARSRSKSGFPVFRAVLEVRLEHSAWRCKRRWCVDGHTARIPLKLLRGAGAVTSTFQEEKRLPDDD